jgi:hypothetical protein
VQTIDLYGFSVDFLVASMLDVCTSLMFQISVKNSSFQILGNSKYGYVIEALKIFETLRAGLEPEWSTERGVAGEYDYGGLIATL